MQIRQSNRIFVDPALRRQPGVAQWSRQGNGDVEKLHRLAQQRCMCCDTPLVLQIWPAGETAIHRQRAGRRVDLQVDGRLVAMQQRRRLVDPQREIGIGAAPGRRSVQRGGSRKAAPVERGIDVLEHGLAAACGALEVRRSRDDRDDPEPRRIGRRRCAARLRRIRNGAGDMHGLIEVDRYIRRKQRDRGQFEATRQQRQNAQIALDRCRPGARPLPSGALNVTFSSLMRGRGRRANVARPSAWVAKPVADRTCAASSRRKASLDKVQGTIAATRTAAIPGARIHLIFLFIAAFVRGTPIGHAARGVSQNSTGGRPAAACNRENGEDWAV